MNGVVTVEKKANVVAEKVNCGGLVVRGKLKGNIIARGPVLVGPEAEIKGDIKAKSIRQRATLENAPVTAVAIGMNAKADATVNTIRDR